MELSQTNAARNGSDTVREGGEVLSEVVCDVVYPVGFHFYIIMSLLQVLLGKHFIMTFSNDTALRVIFEQFGGQ